MKQKIVLFHILFLLAMIGIVSSVLAGGSYWTIIGLTLIGMIMVAMIFTAWMSYLTDLVNQSSQTLNSKHVMSSKWSLNYVGDIKKNQELIKRKFIISAELIGNLAKNEVAATSTDLLVNDPIGEALQKIRSEMQKLKAEEEKRAWINVGLARFSEILRNKSEIKEYSHQIISNLVKYVQANQGALFIEYKNESNERYLELTACYAYDKRKYLENKIYEGQGLLGQCMLERDIIFITDIPKDYIKITSGLGQATPRNVIVAPLIFNNAFYGAIELALFEVMAPYRIEFLKEVCDNIASEIATLKNTQHTEQLLSESTVLTQELQTREEEMKQNLEELAATQEEMARKQAELSGILSAIDSTLATAEFETDGTLIKCNTILEQFFESQPDQLKRSPYTRLIGSENQISWNDILSSKIKAGDFETKTIKGNDLWLSVTFTAIINLAGITTRILCLIQDITQRKIKEGEFERLSLVANNTDNSVIITDKNGITEYVNAGFTKMSGYKPSQIIGVKPGSLLQGKLTDNNTVLKLRKDIKEGIPIYEEILNYNSKGESYWVSLAINPVKDAYGKIIRYISIQADITQTKIKSLDFHQKMQALSRSNAIIELDRGGKIIDANENYLEILGYTSHEVIGKPYSFLSKKEHIFNKLLKTIDEHGMQNGIFSRYDKQGTKHFLKLMDYPVLNIKGEVEKIIEFGVDVTNEKRLEREASLKQAELTSYLSGINNTIASAEFALDGSLQNANDIFLKVMGYRLEEITNKTYDFFMDDDPSVIMMWENLRLGKFFSGEFKMKDHTGKVLWLTGTFNPIIIENEVPEKLMMFAQFTTQEKEKVNELNMMVSALKSTLPVVEFNDQFNVKTANEKFMKLVGLTRIEMRTKSILDFIDPSQHEVWNARKHEIASREYSTISLPIKIKNTIVTYQVSTTIAKNLEGQMSKIIMLLVKEEKEAVQALASA